MKYNHATDTNFTLGLNTGTLIIKAAPDSDLTSTLFLLTGK